MDTNPQSQPGGPPLDQTGSPARDLDAVAGQIAAQFGAAPVSDRPRGGRRSFLDELGDYCRRNGVRLVPAGDAGPDPAPAGPPPPPVAPVDDSPSVMVDPAIIADLARTGLEAVSEARKAVKFKLARLAGCDQGVAAEVAARGGAPPGGIPVLSACAGHLAEKYQALGRWSLEGAAAFMALYWIASDRKQIQELKALARANARKDLPPEKPDKPG